MSLEHSGSSYPLRYKKIINYYKNSTEILAMVLLATLFQLEYEQVNIF
jgi:hypothetical protein